MKKTVVGVIKDFHYGTLKEKVGPQVLEFKNSESAFIKFEKGKAPAVMAAIERAFKNTFPDHYFQYSFLEDKINLQYAGEQRWKLIIGFAAMIAIVICTIGLFGLVHFATVQRTREIGIRKVLGATEMNISLLISKDFLRLVLLSLVLACPVSWYFMNGWLQNFSYRIEVSWFDFVVGGLLAGFITILTIGVLTIRAALANPVKSIRTE